MGAFVHLPEGVEPFAEAPGRAFIVSGPESVLAGRTGVSIIGRVGGDTLKVVDRLELAVSELREARERGLAKFL